LLLRFLLVSEGRVEVFGRYFVYEPLGVGGMARVDRAELVGIEGFRRPVALKRMLPHVAASDEMVQAFVREARLLSHLRHANLAQTYELGKVDGVYFIAMELVTGPTLRDVLQRCAEAAGPMPIRIALNLLSQICDALDYAHNLRDQAGQPLGIIHRDVSPSNVIVDEGGVAKLIDFGVAKASAAGMQTMTGMIKGKFGYMAPEYLAGELDARADLFAVGVIAHELLTARPLFSTGDDLETMRRLRRMTIHPPSKTTPEVPPAIDDIVLRALARDPDRRWQAAAALRAALAEAAERLGLACTNREVIEWIARALGLRRPPTAKPAPEAATEVAIDREPSEPSLQIELQSGTAVELPPAEDGDLPAPGDSRSLIDATVLQTSSDGIPLPDAAEPITAPRPHPLAPPRAPSVRPLPEVPRAPDAAHDAALLDAGTAPFRRTAAPAPKRRLRSPGPSAPLEPWIGISPARPIPPAPLLLPLPAPPLPPLPYHPRRGTTGPQAPLLAAAPDRRRRGLLVVLLVLLAAALTAAGAYLVLTNVA
jgi:serine/threonine protein kinase